MQPKNQNAKRDAEASNELTPQMIEKLRKGSHQWVFIENLCLAAYGMIVKMEYPKEKVVEAWNKPAAPICGYRSSSACMERYKSMKGKSLDVSEKEVRHRYGNSLGTLKIGYNDLQRDVIQYHLELYRKVAGKTDPSYSQAEESDDEVAITSKAKLVLTQRDKSVKTKSIADVSHENESMMGLRRDAIDARRSSKQDHKNGGNVEIAHDSQSESANRVENENEEDMVEIEGPLSLAMVKKMRDAVGKYKFSRPYVEEELLCLTAFYLHLSETDAKLAGSRRSWAVPGPRRICGFRDNDTVRSHILRQKNTKPDIFKGYVRELGKLKQDTGNSFKQIYEYYRREVESIHAEWYKMIDAGEWTVFGNPPWDRHSEGNEDREEGDDVQSAERSKRKIDGSINIGPDRVGHLNKKRRLGTEHSEDKDDFVIEIFGSDGKLVRRYSSISEIRIKEVRQDVQELVASISETFKKGYDSYRAGRLPCKRADHEIATMVRRIRHLALTLKVPVECVFQAWMIHGFNWDQAREFCREYLL
mmetsp:Transcript_19939/g.34278  ORF Transcript_19939/g.34278 Transcript_19939/m.34278 type:complete len:531 (-) Transcript_19939:366-1958(-)